MKTLFKRGNFISSSGKRLRWKVECDSLSNADIDCLAYVIRQSNDFSKVVGVPRGGLRLASALAPFVSKLAYDPVLIVDDVLTTGKSMEEMRKTINHPIIGVVIFARGKCPHWVVPIWQLEMGG